MNADPDDALLQRLALGDESAMRVMVARKLPRLVGLCARMLGDAAEAEDVAQETFLRIWKQAVRWRPGRARFDTWIYKVALNLCYDRLRKRRNISLEEAPDAIGDGVGIEAGAVEVDQGQGVKRALAAIAPRQREAIILVYYESLSNVAAAEAMGISVDALESLLARGRRALHALLMKDEISDQ
jgi:RNA polymerase sigma-70 factor (ECF subfamily)